MQYPLRPCDRPYDIASVNSVRYKPRSGKLEIELPNTGEAANPRNVDSEATPNLRVDTRVLVSTESPVHVGYCVAQMRDGALHLTPVDAAFQMRPSLAHLDAADDKRKQEDAGAAAGGRGLAGDRRDAAGGTDEETDTKKEREDAQRGELASLGAPEPGHSLVPLQVQVKRRETERQTEMRLHSHAYLKQQEEDERWSRLIPVKGNHPYAVVARNRVVSGANGADTDGMDTSTDMDFTGPAGVPITAVAYLDALCPIHSQELEGGMPGDGARDASRNAGDPATTFAAGVSKAQLESLPLAQRVHALFAKGQRSVLRFQRVMHFAPAGSDPEEVIAALRGVAHLVQGCWVACSALRCGGDARRERVRDHVLFHFAKSRDVSADAFGRNQAPPPPGELGLERLRREVLSELAVQRVGGSWGGAKGAGAGAGGTETNTNEGWSFVEQTDTDFIDKYPNLVRSELERWVVLSPWLEVDAFTPSAVEKVQPAPQPPFVSNGVAAAAQTLVLPNIAKDGVVKLSTIRQQLERSGNLELQQLCLLLECEILGILGRNVCAVDGLVCLRRTGDETIDPFRGFLIGLLRKRGRAVRRTELMEGAAAALGAAPTNAVYTKCLSDLCVSRGSTWVMKGNGNSG